LPHTQVGRALKQGNSQQNDPAATVHRSPGSLEAGQAKRSCADSPESTAGATTATSALQLELSSVAGLESSVAGLSTATEDEQQPVGLESSSMEYRQLHEAVAKTAAGGASTAASSVAPGEYSMNVGVKRI
jgi:hypothetical protein